jgi:hypothetical protein
MRPNSRRQGDWETVSGDWADPRKVSAATRTHPTSRETQREVRVRALTSGARKPGAFVADLKTGIIRYNL